MFKYFLIMIFSLHSVSSYSTQSLPPRAVKPEKLINFEKLISFSNKKYTDLFKDLEHFMNPQERAKIYSLLSEYPNLKIPRLTVVTLNTPESFRLIMDYKTDTISIEFRNDSKKSVVVSGIVFSEEDLQSFEKILKKLSNNINFKENFSESDKNQISFMNGLLPMFYRIAVKELLANDEKCLDEEEGICWDQGRGLFANDLADILKKQIHLKSVSSDSLRRLHKKITQRIENCFPEEQFDGACQNFREKEKALKIVLKDSGLQSDPSPQSEVEMKSKKREDSKVQEMPRQTPQTSVPTTSTSSNFWSQNKNWMKPLLIIGGSVLFLWGILSRKKGTKTSIQNGINAPSNPIYTGTGIK